MTAEASMTRESAEPGVSGASTVPGGWSVLRAHDRSAAPWKNGGGITREVAAGPAGAGLDDFSWRVSLAEVGQGGPFSSFSGVDRVITLVEGPGMELTVDGARHTIAAPHQPFAFPGDAMTTCRLLGGPIGDLNVMTRRTRATAHVRMAHEDFSPAPRSGELVLVIALLGTVTFEEPGVVLDRLDAAVLSGQDVGAVPVEGEVPAQGAVPAQGTVRVEGTAAVITLTPVPRSPGL
ncbi:HutD family protein [Streptomyces sp. NBC_00932]|uniref:HutD/Ves family protein n=1 Tax=Streptomyces sp. NBC_00932 TaxID=2903690 RepID=UPI0038643DC1|nr:HutD family protein [Streptomyces sp. NBC_00932]